MLVAGVDSSTQSTKVLLCQAEDGAVVGEAAAPHPDGTECDPELWWQALGEAGHGLLDRADAIGVAAQQHGMVVLGRYPDPVGAVQQLVPRLAQRLPPQFRIALGAVRMGSSGLPDHGAVLGLAQQHLGGLGGRVDACDQHQRLPATAKCVS